MTKYKGILKKPIEIAPGIRIIDLVLQIGKTIVIGDVHIGYEEALNKQGYMVPRTHFKDIMERMAKILDIIKPERAILIGDVKHEFGTISSQEWRETLQFLDLLLSRCMSVILIKGNHDTVLGPIAKKRRLEIVQQHIMDGVLFVHGDKIPDIPANVNTVVIGHEHPAVMIRDKIRSETYKCFLKGTYKKKTLIVLPSFHPLSEGTNVLHDRLLSPFLQRDISSFDVYAVADRVYCFGKLKNLL